MNNLLRTIPLSLLFFAAPLQAKKSCEARVLSWSEAAKAASMVASFLLSLQTLLEKGRGNQV